MNEKKIYCGSGKKQNEGWLKVTINPEKIQEYIQEYEGKKYVKLNINILDKPNNFGKDVQITIDTYVKPDRAGMLPESESLPKEEEPKEKRGIYQKDSADDFNSDDDLPF